MNIADVGSLSLGQYVARCREWNRAHGGGVKAPTEAEFEEALTAAAMGVS